MNHRNVWVVFDPFTNGHRAYDLDLWNSGASTGYVSPPGTLEEARAAARNYREEKARG